jgi:hypothetical protein
MKRANNTIGETFSQMTASKARRWYELKYLSTSGYLLAIREIMAPPGVDFTIPNITKFCKEWAIPKSSFYKAINILVQNNDISWEATEGVIIKSCGEKVVKLVETHNEEQGILNREQGLRVVWAFNPYQRTPLILQLVGDSDPLILPGKGTFNSPFPTFARSPFPVPFFANLENGGQPSQLETPVQNQDILSQILDCESHSLDVLSQIVDCESHSLDSDIYIDRARVDMVDITNEVDKIHIQESARVTYPPKVEILEPEVKAVDDFSIQVPIQSESLVVNKVLHEGKTFGTAPEIVMTLLSTSEPENFPTRPNGKQRVFPWDKLHPTRGYIILGSFAEYLSQIMKDWTGFKGKDLKVQARFVQNYVDKAQTNYQRFRDVCSYWDDYQEFTIGGKQVGILNPLTGQYTSDPMEINILKGMKVI